MCKAHEWSHQRQRFASSAHVYEALSLLLLKVMAATAVMRFFYRPLVVKHRGTTGMSGNPPDPSVVSRMGNPQVLSAGNTNG